YRIIDFKRKKDGVWAKVLSIEYDPNRSARIALLKYEDGTKTYILAPAGLAAGDKVISGESAEPRTGNCLPLRKIPLGMSIHNLEMQPGHGGQLCRSAGTSATLTAREGKWAQITLPSGEVRRISSECRATIRTAGGRHPCSPTGVLAKGGKTRKKRKPSNTAIIRRRRPGPHYAAK